MYKKKKYFFSSASFIWIHERMTQFVFRFDDLNSMRIDESRFSLNWFHYANSDLNWWNHQVEIKSRKELCIKVYWNIHQKDFYWKTTSQELVTWYNSPYLWFNVLSKSMPCVKETKIECNRFFYFLNFIKFGHVEKEWLRKIDIKSIYIKEKYYIYD